MRKSSSNGFFGMGASLLLTVFLVLMLVTFSLLSLAAARNDLNRSRLLAQRRQAYYAANNQAERVLHQLSLGEVPEVPVTQSEDFLEFEIPITEDQVLYVSLQQKAEEFTVTQWKTLHR